MQKIFTLVVLLYTYAYSTAQTEQPYFNYEWNIDHIRFDPVQHEIPEGTREIHYTVKTRGKTFESVKTYNEQGLITALYPAGDAKNKRNAYKITYDEHLKISQATISKKGKVKYTYNYQHSSKGSPLLQEKKRYNKVLYKNVHIYNEYGNPTESIRYGKGGKQIKSRIVTEYYDRYNKSKTTQYNAKGKVKKTWTYNCKEEGEPEQKKKETRICINQSISGDVLTKVYQSFDEKGQTTKGVYKYHLPDSTIFEFTQYNNKEQIVHHVTYDNSFERMLQNTFYKKGKPEYSYSYSYKNGLVTELVYYNKGKMKSKGTYVYNTEGFMTNHKWSDKKDKILSEVMIGYP